MTMELALVAKVTVVFAAALGTARLMRSARASLRSLILASAFALVFLLPFGSAIAPSRQVKVPLPQATAFLLEDLAAVATAGRAESAPALPQPRRGRSRPTPATVARVVWVLGAAAFATPLLVGLWRTHRIRRRSRLWETGQQHADSLFSSGGWTRRIEVVVHDDLLAPMTCGWLRPVIALPGDAVDWPEPELDQVLRHELEHIRRRDWPVHVLARFTCALYWFHPAAWIAWRRLSLESERACDDAVVAHSEHTAYAEQLVALARRFQATRAPLLSMADRRTLAPRVAAILNRNLSRGRVGTGAAAAIVVSAAGLAAALAPIAAVGAQTRERDSLTIPTSIDGPPFEVVSVRPNEPDDRLRVNDWQPATGRLTLRNLTPKVMLTVAYATTPTLFLPDDRLLGVPEWAEQERFTIEAVAGHPVTAVEMQRMLRRVLVERFGLRMHLEQRQQTSYRLTLAADGRLGPNLKAAKEDTCKTSRRPRSSEWGTQELQCMTIDLLALDLSERLGRPVLNQTRLTGIFDGTLTYSPSAEELAVIYQLSPSELPPAAFTGPSLTTALREQLGLRLDSTRAAIDVLVVERLDRPTPNDSPDVLERAPQAATPANQLWSPL